MAPFFNVFVSFALKDYNKNLDFIFKGKIDSKT